jgi:hypothetical protein
MRINVWMEIRNTFAFPPQQDENGLPEDSELQAKNRKTFALAADYEVVSGLFKTRSQGPNTYALYSFLYDVETSQELEQAVELFQSENPGDTKVMGAWDYFTGLQLRDNNVPVYPIQGSLLQYMPDVTTWNGDEPPTYTVTPANMLTDVNISAGQAPREFNT